MGIRTDEGDELVIGPNQVFDLPPGHVTWVEGDEELVMVDWAGGAGFDTPPGEGARVMATILFTDIVDSTVQARKEGDAAWKHTVTMHEDIVRTVLVRFGGRELETAGDSFLIVFDGAERAIRCGLELVDALAAIRSPSASAFTAARWHCPKNVSGVSPFTPPLASLRRRGRARCSCPAPRATSPRALQGWRLSCAGDTGSRV